MHLSGLDSQAVQIQAQESSVTNVRDEQLKQAAGIQADSAAHQKQQTESRKAAAVSKDSKSDKTSPGLSKSAEGLRSVTDGAAENRIRTDQAESQKQAQLFTREGKISIPKPVPRVIDVLA